MPFSPHLLFYMFLYSFLSQAIFLTAGLLLWYFSTPFIHEQLCSITLPCLLPSLYPSSTMHITDHPTKEQVLLSLERLRSMAPSANILSPPSTTPVLETDLSISLSGSSARKPSFTNPNYQSPTQPLDLLPLYPPSSALLRPQFTPHEAQQHQGLGSHSQLLFGRMPSQYNAVVPQSVRQATSPGSASRCVSIDMNQIPTSSESDEGEEERGYPILQLSDSLHKQRGEAVEGSLSSCLKREREKMGYDNMNTNGSGMYEVSSRASDEEEGGSTRKKLRLTKEQSALLEESFKEHSTLNPKQKNALAKQLSLRPRQVEVWFQNRRARTKLKQTEVDCELLKRCCESLTEENRRLQKEVQELRALKVGAPCVIAHDFYMPLPAATLTMCPSCERIGSLDPSARPVSNKQQPTSAGPPHLLQQPSLGFNPHHPQPSAACS